MQGSSQPSEETDAERHFFSCLDRIDRVVDLRGRLEQHLRKGYLALACERRRSYHAAQSLDLIWSDSNPLNGGVKAAHPMSPPQRRPPLTSSFALSPHLREASQHFAAALAVCAEVAAESRRMMRDAQKFAERAPDTDSSNTESSQGPEVR
ncbi:hypothetical protein CDCA_CDCA12G3475 [Cyanidium caldarium]|uniref:Uncharacterized protein n=1 Tax=Cyanidium caldarium TaxID=2771 RepID=A0AAV9IZG3_CYACA|nr:hypothetical protein CDCA_CDCA12G3475 [Cyanidium caldarium]|eukprot:ctg_940.g401